MILLGCFGGWLLPASSPAATSATTAAFLVKLNGYYYCLSTAGLQSYYCDVTCDLSPASQRSLETGGLYQAALWDAVRGFHYHIGDGAGKPITLIGAPAPKTGDKSLDLRVLKLEADILEALKSCMEIWKGLVMEPLNDPRDIQRGNLRFLREANGFKVTQGDPSSGEVTASFDMKGKLLEMSLPAENGASTVKPEFTYTDKGYLLRGLTLSSSQLGQSFAFAYGTQGAYWLPKTLTARLSLPGVTNAYIEMVFAFSGYGTSPGPSK